MKVGELRVGQGGFEMMTPTGLRMVTLRCTVDGHVMVDDVSGGGLLLEPLKITQLASSDVAQPHEIARAQRAASSRRRS